jgi:TPR repeat protein
MGADKDKPLPKDLKSLKALAEKGDARAQNNLGLRYSIGQDDREAVKWYRKAADQGYAEAQYTLGRMYYKGQGMEKDDEEAVKWYRKVAEQGYPFGQNKLGLMYWEGEGVPQDFVTAYAWVDIATTNGNPFSKTLKGSFAQNMTPKQIAKAEALVKKMAAKNPKLLKK